MARTFKDLNGEKHDFDYLVGEFTVTLGVDEDIVSGETSGYYVLLDDEGRIDIDEATYNAIEKLL